MKNKVINEGVIKPEQNDGFQEEGLQKRKNILEKYKESKIFNSTQQQLVIPQKRWDFLYCQSKIKQIQFNEKRENKNKEKESKMLSECTFAPNINRKSLYQQQIYSKNDKIPNKNPTTKPNQWVQRREKKIESMKKNKENMELSECIFTPLLVK